MLFGKKKEKNINQMLSEIISEKDFRKQIDKNYKVFRQNFIGNSKSDIEWRTTMQENCSAITDINSFIYALSASEIIVIMSDCICSMLAYLAKNYHINGFRYDVNWDELTNKIQNLYDAQEDIITIQFVMYDYIYEILNRMVQQNDFPLSMEATARQMCDSLYESAQNCYAAVKNTLSYNGIQRTRLDDTACGRKWILDYIEWIPKCFTDYEDSVKAVKELYSIRAAMGFAAYEQAVNSNWYSRQSVVPTPLWDWKENR